MSTIPILVLTQKAEVKLSKLSVGTESFQQKHIQAYYKKKSEPELIGNYTYKNIYLTLFGYLTGKAGTENKHELPPPHDSTLAFGDIVLVASKSDNPFNNNIAFKVEEYELFYSRAFGGFEDLSDADDGEEIVEEEEEYVDDDVPVEEEEFEVEDPYNSEEELAEEEVVIKKDKKKRVLPLVSNTVFNVPLEKQLNHTSEKNTVRLDVLKTLNKMFNNELTSAEVDSLENEIYKASLHEATKRHTVKVWSNNVYKNIYMATLRKIVGNLYTESYVQNRELLQRYKSKEVSFEDICSMNHYSLYKSKWDESIAHQQMVEKRQLEGNKSMATDQFLCTKCFKRECTYYEMQTRSADEPMTIFISCLNCGKHWRQ